MLLWLNKLNVGFNRHNEWKMGNHRQMFIKYVCIIICIYISYSVGVKNNDIVTYVDTKTFSVWNQSTGYALSLVTIARDSGSEHPFYPVG